MMEDDDDEIYQVEKIVDKKYWDEDACYKYLVKWEGYDDDENTWEPAENLNMVKKLVDAFEKNLARKEAAQIKGATQPKGFQPKLAKPKRKSPTKKPGLIKKAVNKDTKPKTKQEDDLKHEGSDDDADPDKSKAPRKRRSTGSTAPTKKRAKPDGQSEIPFAERKIASVPNPIKFQSPIVTPKDTDFPSKILGVKQVGTEIKYLLMWKPRRDGAIPMPTEYTKHDLMARHSSILGDFMLENLTIASD